MNEPAVWKTDTATRKKRKHCGFNGGLLKRFWRLSHDFNFIRWKPKCHVIDHEAWEWTIYHQMVYWKLSHLRLMGYYTKRLSEYYLGMGPGRDSQINHHCHTQKRADKDFLVLWYCYVDTVYAERKGYASCPVYTSHGCRIKFQQRKTRRYGDD